MDEEVLTRDQIREIQHRAMTQGPASPYGAQAAFQDRRDLLRSHELLRERLNAANSFAMAVIEKDGPYS